MSDKRFCISTEKSLLPNEGKVSAEHWLHAGGDLQLYGHNSPTQAAPVVTRACWASALLWPWTCKYNPDAQPVQPRQRV